MRMTSADQRFQIESPARLHLGFLDLSGTLGRDFGSIGMALKGLSTVIIAEPATELVITGPGRERARDYARSIFGALDLPAAIKLSVVEAIPVHAGLGSGTQLGLAIGAAISAVLGLELTTRELASMTGRGQRSGIGIGVFDSGGFVIDGGRGANTVVPPLVSRLDFPDEWRVILILDHDAKGLNGRDEVMAFEALPPMSQEQAAMLCRSALMGLLPALAEREFSEFSRRIAEIQHTIGDYFSSCQGGRYTSPRVCSAVEWLAKNGGLIGGGQTSWGPTGFAFVESEAEAIVKLDALRREFANEVGLEFRLCGGRNHAASATRVDGLLRQSAFTG